MGYVNAQDYSDGVAQEKTPSPVDGDIFANMLSPKKQDDWIVFIVTELDSGKKSYLATISVLSSSESGGMTGTGNSPEAQSCQSSNLKQSINQDNEADFS